MFCHIGHNYPQLGHIGCFSRRYEQSSDFESSSDDDERGGADEEAGGDDEGDEATDMAAMMGFGGFGSTKKGH